MSEFQQIMHAITEEAKTQIPAWIRDAYSDIKTRKEVKSKFKNVFLDEKRLKFPVKDPKGQYNCALIYAAYMRGLLNEHRSAKGSLKTDLGGGYYQQKRQKAKELFDSCNCGEKLHVKLNNEDIGELDFIQFANLIQIDESMLIDSSFESDDLI